MIGFPWYAGPDENTYVGYFDFFQYLGALQERARLRQVLGREAFERVLSDLPPLDQSPGATGMAEPTLEEWDELAGLQIALVDRGRLSLVGLARELLAEDALEWGADLLFTWDADMRFPVGALLQLWRARKPVVGALAFTAREVPYPVLYRMRWTEDLKGVEHIEGSDILLDYPRDQLLGDEQVGGPLAFGAGVMLVQTRVFREMPKPWFNSTGCGEDWFFCFRCAKHGIERWVDTRVKAEHKAHAARWVSEASYWEAREQQPGLFKAAFGPSAGPVQGGRVATWRARVS